MPRVCLINMPFAALAQPAVGLTQLESVVRLRLGAKAEIGVRYLNHDFAPALGLEIYEYIAGSVMALNSGLGDWLFRQAAYPDQPDNTEAYFRRYRHLFPQKLMAAYKAALLRNRAALPELLEAAIDRHALDKADVVGLTSMFAQNVPNFALARSLKQRNPGQMVVIGGANCEPPMGQALIDACPFVDFVFSGPSLISFPEFLEAYFEGARERLYNIPGVLFRLREKPVHADGKLTILGEPCSSHSQTLGAELDIDAEVRLDYEPFVTSFERSFADSGRKPWLTFETSRGCWWGERAHCTFCGLNGQTMGYRGMEAKKAKRLIQELLRFYPRVQRFQAVDNIMPRNYIQDVFAEIEAPSDATIFYEVKADLTDAELAILARAGVRSVQPGIEALATSVLKLMKKGTTAFRNIQFLLSCLRHGITPYWNLLVGFPGESESVYQKYLDDVPKLRHLQPPYGAFTVRFDRYSPYFMKAEEYGLKLEPLDFYRLIYPLPPSHLSKLAYYFADMNTDVPYAVAAAKWIVPLQAKVEEWLQLWRRGKHSCPVLRLEEENASARISDTRFGPRVLYELTQQRLDLLKHLAEPRRLDKLAAGLAHVPDLDLERELKWLDERQLLFWEDGRLMSLVLNADASLGKRPTL